MTAPPTAPCVLPIVQLRLDGNTQSRELINADVVEEYAEAMAAGATFPPVTAFFDGSAYWVGDGHHRVRAAVLAGLPDIDVEVHQGSRDDARWHAASANQRHGLPRSNRDKRSAVLMALQSPHAAGFSDRSLGDHCGVSAAFVNKLRQEFVHGEQSPDARTGVDGHKRGVHSNARAAAGRASAAKRAAAKTEKSEAAAPPAAAPPPPAPTVPPVLPPCAEPESHQPPPAPLTLHLFHPALVGDCPSPRRRPLTYRRALGAVLSMSEDEQLALCNDVVARVVDDGDDWLPTGPASKGESE